MKISLDWLGDYVEIGRSAEQIAEILRDRGFPTEGIDYFDGDTIIDVEVTSNRGDCLSHIGIARELAAATGKQLKLPELKETESDRRVGEFTQVNIEEPKLCGRYTARIICGVKVGPSPEWMRKRLEAVGVRSVNNVVDATNYAMMECGQPPHAFDYDKLNGGRIIVRKAKAGERIVSIDGTKCDLDENMLVIADTRGSVAIAGVMGGLDTEIENSTTTVLLEDAQFDPVSIRATERKLSINSEASFRFERMVDIEMMDWASRRCAELIVEVAGGQIASGAADDYPQRWSSGVVQMRQARLNALLGVEVPKEEVVKILSSLGFEPRPDGDAVACSVPTWRHDIYREADLIEEVARSYGYDKIPLQDKINIEVVPVGRRQKTASRIRTYLNGCGFYETINITFAESGAAALFEESQDTVYLGVGDTSRKGANLLRRNLIVSLLDVYKTNCNAGNMPCSLYEIANTYKAQSGDKSDRLPSEGTKAALALEGDFRRLRGVVEGLARILNKDMAVVFEPRDFCWASVGAEIIAGGKSVGVAGIISEKVKAHYDIEGNNVCAAELDFDLLCDMQGGVAAAKPIPKYPSVTRDLSLIVDETLRWAQISEAIGGAEISELEDVKFAGIYRGKPIEAGKKSVTVSLRFRDDDGTLTHEAVDGFQERILKKLTAVGAQLRTV